MKNNNKKTINGDYSKWIRKNGKVYVRTLGQYNAVDMTDTLDISEGETGRETKFLQFMKDLKRRDRG